jgi:large subunit ribosomal protein L32
MERCFRFNDSTVLTPENLAISNFRALVAALMGVPKRKTSKMRLRTRKAANAWRASELNKCPQCGSTARPHIACPSCGYYKGRQVLSVGA